MGNEKWVVNEVVVWFDFPGTSVFCARHAAIMATNNNSVNNVHVLSTPASTTTLQTLTHYHRPRTLSHVLSNISAAARRRVRRIRCNHRTLICNASTVLREVAMNQINILFEQAEFRAESRTVVNSTNAIALLLNLHVQDLERTLGRVTYNLHLVLCRLNDWKNEVYSNTCSDEILDLHAATVDIFRNAA